MGHSAAARLGNEARGVSYVMAEWSGPLINKTMPGRFRRKRLVVVGGSGISGINVIRDVAEQAAAMTPIELLLRWREAVGGILSMLIGLQHPLPAANPSRTVTRLYVVTRP